MSPPSPPSRSGRDLCTEVADGFDYLLSERSGLRVKKDLHGHYIDDEADLIEFATHVEIEPKAFCWGDLRDGGTFGNDWGVAMKSELHAGMVIYRDSDGYHVDELWARVLSPDRSHVPDLPLKSDFTIDREALRELPTMELQALRVILDDLTRFVFTARPDQVQEGPSAGLDMS